MEKNRRSRKAAKVVLAGVSLMAVSAITFGATMAYLTATTNTKTNTFSASASVDIELTETSWTVDTNTHEITPETTVPKNPQITNQNTSDTAYVAIGLSFWIEDSAAGATEKTYTQISYDDFCKFASFEGLDTTNWTAATENTSNASATDKEIVYYRNDTLAASATTEALFTGVKFGTADALATNLGYVTGTARYKDVKVTVDAYAIASEGITADTAKSELYNLANPTATA